jgi:plasmid replication initiation protein
MLTIYIRRHMNSNERFFRSLSLDDVEHRNVSMVDKDSRNGGISLRVWSRRSRGCIEGYRSDIFLVLADLSVAAESQC